MKIVVLLLICSIAVMACASKNAESANASGPKTGKELYRKYCVLCHGVKGDRGASGATDLTISVLSREETIDVITNGRDQMAPFRKKMDADEILLVVDHISTLIGP